MVLHEEKIYLIFAWLYGDFTTASWSKFWLILPYVGASWLVMLATSHQLNVLQMGDEEATSLGVRVELVKTVTIVTASLATAVCVAVSGLIGFVGLVVPHVCRMVAGPDHRMLLPMTMLVGATFLTLADIGARTILSPQELPVGILTAFIGAPFFLVLLRRNRRLVAQL
jgi:iron complex transport system permease protein